MNSKIQTKSKEQTEEKAEEKRKPLALSVPEPQLPVGISANDLAADAGQGSENVGADDLATPLITILQGLSPQCRRSDPKYVEGAQEGMFYNNVTNQVMGTELVVASAYFETVCIEWKAERKGFVAIHPKETRLREQVKMVKNKEGREEPTLPNGNILEETDQHYVLILKPNGDAEPAVMPMRGSGFQASRRWNSLIKLISIKDASGKSFNPARFYGKWKLTTKNVSRNNYSWSVMVVEPAGVNTEYYQAAKEFKQMAAAGSVNIKQEPTGDADDSAFMKPAERPQDDIPLDI